MDEDPDWADEDYGEARIISWQEYLDKLRLTGSGALAE